MRNLKKSSTNRGAGRLVAAVLLLVVTVIVNILVGAAGVAPAELFDALISGPGTTTASRIIWYVRLPRIMAAIITGGGLGVAGAIIQRLLANPLASPGIIGINAGAGLAVALASVFGVYSAWALTGASFLGAMAAALLVTVAAQKTGASRTTVVLGGIAVSAFLNSITEAISSMIPNAAIAGAEFRVGGFSSFNQRLLLPGTLIIVVGILISVSLSNELEIMSLGDETAGSLGVNIGFYRKVFLILSALLAGAAVSMAGVLGFVGLIVPHLSRLFGGSEGRSYLPFCGLVGGCLVGLSDLLARTLFSPYELPVGILMSFIGGPFFIWLLFRKRRANRD